MTTNGLRRILLHGTSEESFGHSVTFAWRLVQTFGAELHVVYTVEEPLSAGWTAETSPARLPELHQAIEEEARERLARVLPPEATDVTVAIRTGEAGRELVRYTAENMVDLAIVRAEDTDAQALVSDGHCSVLLLRS